MKHVGNDLKQVHFEQLIKFMIYQKNLIKSLLLSRKLQTFFSSTFNSSKTYSNKPKPHNASNFLKNKSQQKINQDQILEILNKCLNKDKIVKTQYLIQLLQDYPEDNELTRQVQSFYELHAKKDFKYINNLLLKNFLRQHDIDAFKQIYYNKTRDRVTYLTIIDYYVRQKNKELALEYYQVMNSHFGPDFKALAYVIQYFGRNAKTEKYEQEIYEQLHTCDISTLKCMLVYYIQNNMRVKLIATIQIIKGKQWMDMITYNRILEYISKKNDQKLYLMLQEDLQQIDFNDFTYRFEIKILLQQKNHELAKKSFELMQIAYQKPHVSVFNDLIRYYCLHGMIREAENILDIMQDLSVKIDTQVLNNFFEYYKKTFSFIEAEITYKKILSFDLKPNIVTINNLLYIFVNDFQKFSFYLSEIDRNSLKKDIFTYNAMIMAYQKKQAYQKMETILKQMKQDSIKPNHITISLVIDSFGFTQNFEQLMLFIRDLHYEEIHFDENNFNSILEALYKCRKYDALLQYFKVMCEEIPTFENPKKTFNIMKDSLRHMPKEREIILAYFQEHQPIK